jgi:predicted Zn-dependent protease
MLRIVIVCLLTAFLTSQAFANTEALTEIDNLIATNDLAAAETKLNEQLKANSEAPLLLVRKSRIMSLKGDAASSEEQKVKLFEEAKSVAQKIIDKHPKVAGGYLRSAVSSGKLALYKGILSSRSLILEVKKLATKVVELDDKSKYEEALANYLLGRAHIKVAEKPKAMRLPLGLGWADKKKGAKHLEKAAKLAPDSIPFVLSYAESLIENGKKDEAKKLLEGIKDMKVRDPADPGHQRAAEKLLSSL